MSETHPVRPYLLVFGALAVLTAVTVTLSYLHLPKPLALTAGLLVATLKASLVAAYFMHLKGERLLIYGLLGTAFFFTLFLFLLPALDMTDSRHRLSGDYAARAPQGASAAGPEAH